MGKGTNHHQKDRRSNKKKKKENKTANSPEQDLHPDWDRFRGTMLYPLSCGELAINGEQILRLYVTSGARNTEIMRKIVCLNLK